MHLSPYSKAIPLHAEAGERKLGSAGSKQARRATSIPFIILLSSIGVIIIEYVIKADAEYRLPTRPYGLDW